MGGLVHLAKGAWQAQSGVLWWPHGRKGFAQSEERQLLASPCAAI